MHADTGGRSGPALPQSSLLIPVREADSVIGRWRYEHDPLAKAGVPAHITLIVPWVAPALITDSMLADLDLALGDVKVFEFELTHVDWFARRVLWAAPEPVGPFLDLIGRLSERYGTPPWAGQFEEVIPHLDDRGCRRRFRARERRSRRRGPAAVALPRDEVWVMVGSGREWAVVHKVRLVS